MQSDERISLNKVVESFFHGRKVSGVDTLSIKMGVPVSVKGTKVDKIEVSKAFTENFNILAFNTKETKESTEAQCAKFMKKLELMPEIKFAVEQVFEGMTKQFTNLLKSENVQFNELDSLINFNQKVLEGLGIESVGVEKVIRLVCKKNSQRCRSFG